MLLLPNPRRLVRLGGACELRPDRHLWLAGEATPELLQAGRLLKETLALVGPAPLLTAWPHQGVTASIHVDPAQVPHREGYRIAILPEEVRIVGHDPAGVFYGVMTLRQIARQYEGAGELPCMHIEDWPDFANRGVMIDVSRDKVPTLETLFSLVDTLAEWKINQLQLYTEHTFAYRGHRDVWEDASPMTGGDVLELDAHCRSRFVELVANQNSFGHMERWLMRPRYAQLAENPEAPIPRALDPLDPGSIRLIGELYDELLPHFSSRTVNVGCDEVPLGEGRTREACEKQGVGRVYLDFLLKVHGLVSPNPPKDTDGRREDSGRGWVRELQGRWPGVLG